MTYQSSHDGPLTEPMRNLVKAIDVLFNVEKKLKRSAGGFPVTMQRDRLNKIIKRLKAKDHGVFSKAASLRKRWYCEVCESVNCVHDEPLEEAVLKGPVQSAPRRKR
jgi:hypothetical protein